MSHSPTGLPLGQALAAVLAALGKPAPLLVDQGAGEPGAVISEAVAPLGLAMRAITLEPGLALEFSGLAMLLDLGDGLWQALVPRPGGVVEQADEDGNLSPLPPHSPTKALRGFVLEAVVEPVLSLSVRPFLHRHAKLLVPVVAGGVVTNMLALALPLFGSFVYDKVLGNGISETLWAMAIGVLLATGMDFLARAIRVMLLERVAVITEGDIDRALFNNLLRKSGGMPPLGLVLDKYKQLLASRDFISSTYLMAAADLPFVVLFLITIAVVAGPLVLVPIVFGALAVGLNLSCIGPAREYEQLARKAGEKRVSILADVLMGREVVVTTPLRSEMARQWRRNSDAAAAASGRARFWNGLAMSVNSSITSLAYAAVLVGGAYLVEDRVLTSGGLMAASMLTSRAMSMVASVVLLSTRMREFRRALTELDHIVPAAAQAAVEPRAADPTGEIRLVGLSWRPNADARLVLNNLDLLVRPGEIVGIAGLPGAGKTTLLRLMAGAEKPSQGKVLLDLVPVACWDPRQLARSIGYKPQEALLFEGSLETNILAGNTRVTTDQMRAALERSGLRMAIDRGELTLTDEVGPRGSFLSGGQRQMVALARSLLGEPALMLLDEPSTGVDAQLEKSLAEYIASLAGRRTVLLSSHSRLLLSACTRIIVLQNGRVAADGPRGQVLAA